MQESASKDNTIKKEKGNDDKKEREEEKENKQPQFEGAPQKKLSAEMESLHDHVPFFSFSKSYRAITNATNNPFFEIINKKVSDTAFRWRKLETPDTKWLKQR